MPGSFARVLVRILVVIGVCAVGGSTAFAQDVLNGDFDDWSGVGGSLTHWSSAQTSGSIAILKDTVKYFTWGGNTKSCKLNLGNSTNGWFGKTWTSGYSAGSTLGAKFRVKLSAALASGSISVEATGLNSAGNPVGSPQTIPLALNSTAWQTADVTYVVPSPLPASVYLRVKFTNAPSTSINVDAVVFTWSSNNFATGGRDLVFEPYDLVSQGLTVRVDNLTGGISDILSTVNANTVNPGVSLIQAPITGNPSSQSRLFTLEISQNNSTVDVDESFFQHGAGGGFGVSPTFAATVSAGTRTLTVTFNGGFLGGNPLSLTPVVVVQSTPSSAVGVSFQISVLNSASGYAVEKVFAPLPRMNLTIGASAGDDRLFLPFNEGALVTTAALTYGAPPPVLPYDLQFDYPGHASMQYMAFFDTSNGMMMMSADTTPVTPSSAPSPKQFGFTRLTDNPASPTNWFDMRVAQLFPTSVADIGTWNANHTFLNPIPPVILSETHGTWMKSAETYRGWAHGQAWAHPPTAQPTWISARPTQYDLYLRPEGLGLETAIVQSTMGSEPLYDMLDGWSNDLGPMVVMFRSFERYGTYVGPYYAPFESPWFSESDLNSHWHGLRTSHNTNIATMVAGLKWMLNRNQAPLTGRADESVTYCLGYWDMGFSGKVDPGAIQTESGGGDTGPLNLTVPAAIDVCAIDRNTGLPHDAYFGAAWDGSNYRICPSTVFAKSLHAKLANYSATMGVQLYEFDQMNGGGTLPCYTTWSANHNHSHLLPGYGPWMIFETTNVLSMARANGQIADASFAMAMEDPNELMIPYIDVFYTDVGAYDKYWAYPWTSEAVPAFNYVYGDLIQAMDRPQRLKVDNYLDYDATGAQHDLQDMEAHTISRTCVNGGWIGFALEPSSLVTKLLSNPNTYDYWNTSKGHYPGLQWNFGVLYDFFLQNYPTQMPTQDAIVPYVLNTNTDLLRLLKNLSNVSHDSTVLDIMSHGQMVEATGQITPLVDVLDTDDWVLWQNRAQVPAVEMAGYRRLNSMGPPTYGFMIVNADRNLQTITLPSTLGGVALSGKSYQVRVQNMPFSQPSPWQPGMTYHLSPYDVAFFKIY